MFHEKLHLKEFFPKDRRDVFNYWIQPKLLEKWSAPEGMTLRVPEFDAKKGGRYRYEHESKDGKYVCEGFMKEFIPGEKLVLVDKFVKDPKGQTIFENLECVINFRSVNGGTEVDITQSGFPDEKSLMECQHGWRDCLGKLSQLLGRSGEAEIKKAG